MWVLSLAGPVSSNVGPVWYRQTAADSPWPGDAMRCSGSMPRWRWIRSGVTSQAFTARPWGGLDFKSIVRVPADRPTLPNVTLIPQVATCPN
jgi:hypothetical protein